MIAQNIIEEVVLEQARTFRNKKKGIKRFVDFNYLLNSHLISVISGVRRSGKSTLMRQIAENYPNYNYVNFDDERFINFEVTDFRILMIVWQKRSDAKVIFLDEIQLVEGWERFLRRLFEEEYKIYVSGSNSKLLSSELATHLLGRYQKIELFPFSFKEYLLFKQIDYHTLYTETQSKILLALDHYINGGGFPEYLILNDGEYLKHIYNDIIHRDLIVHFKIKNSTAFKQLAQYLFSNLSKETSYNGLKNTLKFSSSTTVSEYVSYLEQAYLCFEIFKFDFSLKKQIVYNKKIYVIDNGLRNVVAFKNSSDTGRLLENLVYIELKRRQKEVYFYKTKENYKVVFLIREQNLILIQVSYSIADVETEYREKRALFSAMKELSITNSVILTYNEEKLIEEKDYKINVIPIWKWLLSIE